MDVKCRWCAACRKENMETIVPHDLEQLLPEEHCHCICSYIPLERGFTALVKAKISTRDEAEKWLEDFQQSSKVTLRVAKTYPAEDRVRRNIYRVDMRCQHNTRQTGHTKKNTNCPAQLSLVLKKASFGQNRKSRSTDSHIQEGLLFHVTIKHNHNHGLDSAEALQQRDVSRETVEKLEKLFESGHTPISALNTLKYDLQKELGDAYVHASADRSICPDIHFCYRSYYSMHRRRGSLRWSLRGRKVAQQVNWMQPVESEEEEDGGGCSPEPPPTPVEGSTLQDGSGDTATLEGRLRSMFDGLVDKLRQDDTFHAPIECFVSRYERISTDSDLTSALSMFGKTRRGTSHRQMQPSKSLQMPAQIGVQPTAISRRKTPLGGRRTLIAGRPPKRAQNDHSYRQVKEGSGTCPTRLAPPSHVQCVSDGVSLDGQQ